MFQGLSSPSVVGMLLLICVWCIGSLVSYDACLGFTLWVVFY